MTTHDTECPWRRFKEIDPETDCQFCPALKRARADEVERRFGWVTQEDARAWFLADLRAAQTRDLCAVPDGPLLGLATTEELFRELMARLTISLGGPGSTEKALILAEMLGGLDAADQEYRTAEPKMTCEELGYHRCGPGEDDE